MISVSRLLASYFSALFPLAVVHVMFFSKPEEDPACAPMISTCS